MSAPTSMELSAGKKGGGKTVTLPVQEAKGSARNLGARAKSRCGWKGEGLKGWKVRALSEATAECDEMAGQLLSTLEQSVERLADPVTTSRKKETRHDPEGATSRDDAGGRITAPAAEVSKVRTDQTPCDENGLEGKSVQAAPEEDRVEEQGADAEKVTHVKLDDGTDLTFMERVTLAADTTRLDAIDEKQKKVWQDERRWERGELGSSSAKGRGGSGDNGSHYGGGKSGGGVSRDYYDREDHDRRDWNERRYGGRGPTEGGALGGGGSRWPTEGGAPGGGYPEPPTSLN